MHLFAINALGAPARASSDKTKCIERASLSVAFKVNRLALDEAGSELEVAFQGGRMVENCFL